MTAPAAGSGYLVGLGSNVQPEKNVPAMIRMLAMEFGIVGISPVVRTHPIGILSDREFLNAALFVETALPAARVKSFFNAVEERLGRDRADSERQVKDRPADLDILLHYMPGIPLDAAQFPTEPYLRPPFMALCQAMHLVSGTDDHDGLQTVTLQLAGGEFGRDVRFLCCDEEGTLHWTSAPRTAARG